MKEKDIFWISCKKCNGTGKVRKSVPKKVRINYKIALEQYKQSNNKKESPIKPKGLLYNCINCKGSGLINSDHTVLPNLEKYPHIAIIGGGIGGTALAVACQHRKIPYTLYERDASFNERSQGYGLTLQQASKAMAGLGITSLPEGIVSTKHIVHTIDGKVIGEWGIRKWGRPNKKKPPKRTNIHIARQSLRLELLKQLGEKNNIKWNHQFLSFETKENNKTILNFKVNDKTLIEKADIIIGADGIRSTVRKLLIGDKITPLKYLGCIVILGICSLKKLNTIKSSLLDSATVFQTANGNERIYMMPFNADAIMWQLSFPLSESKAKELNKLGPKKLKEEAVKRTQWHTPIPEIVSQTNENQISGYPVYDRELLKPQLLKKENNITLIGDAAHPMSPFKGQGANQALLDALDLARIISKKYNSAVSNNKLNLIQIILSEFESRMIERSASKVKSSSDAAKLLHSDVVLYKGDGPRGKLRDNKKA